MAPRTKIAYYGGSFNPVHRGHLYVARAALRIGKYDRVHFLPARCPPHKSDAQMLPEALRLELLRLAVEREPRFVVDDFEIANPRYRYTFDTLTALAERDPESEIHFLIGGDSLLDLPKWYRAAELVSKFTIVTAPRDPDRTAGQLCATLSGRLPEAALARLRAHVLPIRPWPIAASDIRAGLDEETLKRVLPRKVRLRLAALDLLPSRRPHP